MGAFSLSVTTVISQPVVNVYAYVIDLSNLPSWASGFQEIRNFSGNPAAVGTSWTTVSRFMGREIANEHEIIELEEGRRCVFTIDSPVFSGKNIWEFNTTEEGATSFTLCIEGETKGWLMAMARPLIRSQALNTTTKDSKKLRLILETQTVAM